VQCDSPFVRRSKSKRTTCSPQCERAYRVYRNKNPEIDLSKINTWAAFRKRLNLNGWRKCNAWEEQTLGLIPRWLGPNAKAAE
jgi:hypothetical protein